MFSHIYLGAALLRDAERTAENIGRSAEMIRIQLLRYSCQQYQINISAYAKAYPPTRKGKNHNIISSATCFNKLKQHSL